MFIRRECNNWMHGRGQYNKFTRLIAVGPFQLVSHKVPNRQTGRQETYWGKENIEST